MSERLWIPRAVSFLARAWLSRIVVATSILPLLFHLMPLDLLHFHRFTVPRLTDFALGSILVGSGYCLHETRSPTRSTDGEPDIVLRHFGYPLLNHMQLVGHFPTSGTTTIFFGHVGRHSSPRTTRTLAILCSFRKFRFPVSHCYPPTCSFHIWIPLSIAIRWESLIRSA